MGLRALGHRVGVEPGDEVRCRQQPRYTGAGLGYNLAGIFGGAIPPLFAAGWVASGDVMNVGMMLAGLSAISVLCTYFMVESKDTDMGQTDATPSGKRSVVDGPEGTRSADPVGV